MSITKHLNNILKIFEKDLKAAFSNPIVIIALIAIMILPSLYALLNIQACWDPYEKTDNLEFAIVNEDMSVTYENEKINIGNELVKELKNNNKFNWKFVSLEDAKSGVRDGKYIAAIVIPKEFSKNITSIDSEKSNSAIMRYIVSEKNPVSSRMSDAAAKEINRKVSNKIVEVIDIMAVDKLTVLKSSLASGANKLSAGASTVNSGVSQVNSGSNKLSSASSQLNSGSEELSKSANQITAGSKQVTAGSKQVTAGSNELKKSVDVEKIPDPQIKAVVNGSINLANSSSAVAEGSSKLADSSVKLAKGSNQLAKGSNQLAKGSNQLATSSIKLADGSVSLASGSSLLANSASNALYTASNSLDSVTDLDRTYLGDFFYSPVKLKTEKVFPVENYGSEVAPFYLVLSMWVGSIIACVMLKMRYNDRSEFSPLEYYFGKQALFLAMALGQSTITIIGSFILGFQISNIPLFILSMYLVSIIFMFIIYSFISIFGQIGKAFMLIVLVLQISGSGGIYPVSVMDPFFQMVNPFLPMTYGISMLREVCIGLVWNNYLFSLLTLLIFPIIVFIISILIKEKLDKTENNPFQKSKNVIKYQQLSKIKG